MHLSYFISCTLIVLLIQQSNADSPLTKASQDELFKLHNEKRSIVNPAAANMRRMTYSEDLALSAQAYAELCLWEHGTGDVSQRQIKTFGQNLFASSNKNVAMTSTINSWFNEASDYTFSSNGCSKVCGHYTQMVWATSHLLGCGGAWCQKVQKLDAFAPAYVVVCHYSPQGNVVGQKPYVSGASCSKCPAEANVCVNNLCSLNGTVSPPNTNEGNGTHVLGTASSKSPVSLTVISLLIFSLFKFF